MTSLQIGAVAFSMEDDIQVEKAPQPSNIKIRFKKGVAFAKSSDGSAGVNVMAGQVLGPESEKKRKVAQVTGFENSEQAVSDMFSSCKMRVSQRTENILTDTLSYVAEAHQDQGEQRHHGVRCHGPD
jgi:hypothetical protein